MIILGGYAGWVEAVTRSPISALHVILNRLAIPGAAVHLLCPYPSCGDDGFALVDWFSIDPNFGSSAEVSSLADAYPLIMDGVYGHVGLEHPIVRSADARHLAILSKSDEDTLQSQDHRGRATTVMDYAHHGQQLRLLQSFGSKFADLNPKNPTVRDLIVDHLAWIRELGAVAVRLDAVAYYGKHGEDLQLHSDACIELVSFVSSHAHQELPPLTVVAQADIDDVGRRYILEGAADVCYDYAFPALVVSCLLLSDVRYLRDHLNRSEPVGSDSVRPLRTHDGIYLGSPNLTARARHDITNAAIEFELPIDWIDGRPYELTSSLPLLCRTLADDADGNWRSLLDAATLLTIFSSRNAYLYLPALIGCSPELEFEPSVRSEDYARRVNRSRYSESTVGIIVDEFERSGSLRMIRKFAVICSPYLSQTLYVTSSESNSVIVLRRGPLIVEIDFARRRERERPIPTSSHDRLVLRSDRVTVGFG